MVRVGGRPAVGARTVTTQLASARPNAPLDDRPGLHPMRLARLVDEAVARLRLDLRDAVVLTEAATGSYAVTPVIAARAGAARVYAMGRDTRFGSVGRVTAGTLDFARLLGVGGRIEC